MPKATATHTAPRPEPEVLAANVRVMLAPFFNGRSAGPTPVLAETKPVSPTPSRDSVAATVEALIDLMDAIDGDADFELVCEDEGGECNDEGIDSDREPCLGRPEAYSQVSGHGPFSERHHRDGGLFEFGGATYDVEYA